MFCPYCKKETNVPGSEPDAMEVSRATCERCHKEFVIIENFPMTTKEQYRASKSE
jgi:uncharacterized protein YbaR (Trm112 family)